MNFFFVTDFLSLLSELNTKLNTNDLINIERNMIIEVCSLLKIYGFSIDSGKSNHDSKLLLDSFFNQLLHLIDTNQIDIVTRGHVLHVLELRNNRWSSPNGGAISKNKSDESANHSDGHKQVQWQLEQSASNQQIPSPASSDEKIKDNKVNHHYLKGELLIRNSDSGKGKKFSRPLVTNSICWQ